MSSLADGVVIAGMFGWNMQVTAGPADQPTELVYFEDDQVNQLRETVTWNAEGNPESMFYERTYDSGANWEVIGTKNVAWSPDGAAIAVTWAAQAQAQAQAQMRVQGDVNPPSRRDVSAAQITRSEITLVGSPN
jgi:hypothetical protein